MLLEDEPTTTTTSKSKTLKKAKGIVRKAVDESGPAKSAKSAKKSVIYDSGSEEEDCFKGGNVTNAELMAASDSISKAGGKKRAMPHNQATTPSGTQRGAGATWNTTPKSQTPPISHYFPSATTSKTKVQQPAQSQVREEEDMIDFSIKKKTSADDSKSEQLGPKYFLGCDMFSYRENRSKSFKGKVFSYENYIISRNYTKRDGTPDTYTINIPKECFVPLSQATNAMVIASQKDEKELLRRQSKDAKACFTAE